ncbi:MAG: hypothetical protein IT184_17910 [Acidobacteria bacterium]|nr:hypothetical protein [Acidobacteriota bacterium]
MTTTSMSVPVANDLRRLIAGILGVQVTVRQGSPVNPRSSKPAVAAVYRRDDDEVAAVMACDLELGTAIGAAMTMIPARVAEEMVNRNTIDDMIYDNLREVMNVLASSFNNQTNAVHVRLVDLRRTPAEPLDEAAIVAVQQPAAKADFEIDVPRYGTGRLSCYMA